MAAPGANQSSWVRDFRLGTKLGPNGAIVPGAQENVFEIGDHIHIAMRLQSPPADGTVSVIWKGPEDQKLGEESKRVRPGQDFMYFTADSIDLPAGENYRVEVWIEGKPVGQLGFDLI